jgi:predicted component of type VI protein secretion system
MLSPQCGANLLGSPMPSSPSQASDPLDPAARRFPWRTLGSSRTIPQASWALSLETPQPLVANVPTDPETMTQLAHRLLGLQHQFYKTQSLSNL